MSGAWRYGVLALAAAFGCARSLKEPSEIVAAPEEFRQKMEAFDASAKVAPPPPPPSVPAVPAKKSRKRKSKAEIAKEAAAAAAAAALVDPFPTWSPSFWPFSVGEKITFTLRYGVLEGGIAVLQVKEPIKLEGEPVVHIVGHVKSSRVLELFYKVDDEIQTWIGLSDFLPRRQEIRQNESSRSGRRMVVFDPKAQVAKYYAKTNFSDGREEEHRRDDPVASFAQDVFGALYFYRFIDRERINFPIHDRWKNWNNGLEFIDRQTIRVPAGEFRTVHYKLLPRVTGYLEPKGDVEIWVKDDPSRILVQFKAKIKVGSLTGELKEYEAGTGWDLPLPAIRTPTDLNDMGEIKAR